MKYLLKAVIQKEIEQLPTHITCTDWKRLTLISNITKLKPKSQTNSDIILKKQNIKPNNISIHVHKNIKQTSTIELLINGFLRNHMNINNNNFPMDISCICEQFIGNISNIAIQSLRLFSHKENNVISSIQQPIASRSIAKTEFFSNKLSHRNMKLKLVSTNKILMEHFQNNFYYFNYVKDNTNIEISDNVQKLNDNTLNYKHNYVYGVVQCM
eukprot:30612_1